MQGQVDEVADRLHSAAIHLLRRAAGEDAASGLSRARLSALSVVVFRGPLTLGELADAEGVRSATMTGIVRGLVGDALVRRRPSPEDGRAVLLDATPKGRRLLNRARARRIGLVAARLSDLSETELALVARAAELVEERFGARPWRPVDR
jgi:DNA-binding MarR family transcriptional regulator